MLLNRNNIAKKPMWRVVLVSLIQAVVLFFGSAYLFIRADYFEFPHYIHFEIFPFFVLFLLFNISCNNNDIKLKRWVLVFVGVLYFMMSLFANGYFVDLCLMVIISSSILAHSHVKHAGGNKKEYARMLMPVFVTIIQIVFVVILSDYYRGIYDNEGNFPSVYRSTWNHYERMGGSLFLVTSLIANFAVLIWNRWWFLLLMGVGMMVFSSLFFWHSEFFVVKVPSVIALVYAFGIMITNLMNLVFSGFDFRVWFKKICSRS